MVDQVKSWFLTNLSFSNIVAFVSFVIVGTTLFNNLKNADALQMARTAAIEVQVKVLEDNVQLAKENAVRITALELLAKETDGSLDNLHVFEAKETQRFDSIENQLGSMERTMQRLLDSHSIPPWSSDRNAYEAPTIPH
jgi:hypothetical protein